MPQWRAAWRQAEVTRWLAVPPEPRMPATFARVDDALGLAVRVWAWVSRTALPLVAWCLLHTESVSPYQPRDTYCRMSGTRMGWCKKRGTQTNGEERLGTGARTQPLDPSGNAASKALTACRICAGKCALRLKRDGIGKVIAAYGDREDPLTRGYACFKGLHLADAHYDPTRLHQCLKRTGSAFEWHRAIRRGAVFVSGDDVRVDIGRGSAAD